MKTDENGWERMGIDTQKVLIRFWLSGQNRQTGINSNMNKLIKTIACDITQAQESFDRVLIVQQPVGQLLQPISLPERLCK